MIWRPSRLVEEYLADNETVIFDEAPDLRAWLAMQWLDLMVAVVIVVIMFASDNGAIVLLGLVGEIVILGSIAYRLADRAFTRYVLTEYRALRTSGVFRRDYEWISWKKVTDVSVQRSFVDRWFGTATIKIQSANEMSGFKAMTDVPAPRAFAAMIVDMVNAAQGAVEVPENLPTRR